jgi:hypothetical protein
MQRNWGHWDSRGRERRVKSTAFVGGWIKGDSLAARAWWGDGSRVRERCDSFGGAFCAVCGGCEVR